jgi:hypothetical protein
MPIEMSGMPPPFWRGVVNGMLLMALFYVVIALVLL